MSEINKAMQCTVCSKYWRKGDNDLIPCKTCNRTVHIGCDNNAELVLKRAGGDKSIATKTYEVSRFQIESFKSIAFAMIMKEMLFSLSSYLPMPPPHSAFYFLIWFIVPKMPWSKGRLSSGTGIATTFWKASSAYSSSELRRCSEGRSIPSNRRATVETRPRVLLASSANVEEWIFESHQWC